MAIETLPWDIVDSLTSESRILAYLEAALDDDDPRLLVVALRDIARVRGMAHIADEVGLSPEALMRMLSAESDPSFATVSRVLSALGFKLVPVANVQPEVVTRPSESLTG